MKKLGQHFLKNNEIAKKIIKAIDVQPDETIIEIGPGHGELTISLAEICRTTGAQLIAIEKDKRLADALAKKNIEVVNGDALDMLTSQAADLKSYKIVGNIPYYITGHLFRIISEFENKPTGCVFMIQKEVAERVCAKPPEMNRLAASVQIWAEPKIIARVPRADFSPAPEVDSAVIKLETRDQMSDLKNEKQYYSAVRALFAQPRKTVLNNLADGQIDTKKSKSKDEIIAVLASMNLDPKLRPQNLTIKDICSLAEKFF